DRLFSSKRKTQEDVHADSERDTKPVHRMEESEPKIQIDRASVTHSFVALPPKAFDFKDEAVRNIDKLLDACQPKLWASVKALKFSELQTFYLVGPKMKTGYPNPTGVLEGLKKTDGYVGRTIVLNNMEVSFDAGRTTTRLYVGFCYRDDNPRVILPYKDAFAPAMAPNEQCCAKCFKRVPKGNIDCPYCGCGRFM
ncbi:hypothetical protein LCGC14_2473610, partial [marine sediment metagenome]